MQDNLLFPQFDLSYRLLIYLLSKLTDSLFAIDILFYRIMIAAMFASSFVVLWQLNVRAWLAAVASVVYVVSPFLVLRSGGHDFLALYFCVPWGAALSYLIARVETFADARIYFLNLFAGAGLLIAGTSGLYYAFFSAMFVAVTAFGMTIGRRDWRPFAVGLSVCAVLLILMLASGYRWHILELFSGRLAQPQRQPIENLSYGLLMSDSVHVLNEIGLFKSRFALYSEGMKFVTGANFLYEWPGPLLSMVIVAAPMFLFVGLFEPEAKRSDRKRVIWLSLLLITFGLIFATRGGLGFLFGYFVAPVIRAPARIIPFLSFFAMVAVCTAIEIMLAEATWLRRAAAAAVVALLLVGLPVRLFPLAALQRTTLARTDLLDSQASMRTMLRAKDHAGLKAVLQLPLLEWPEVGPQLKFEAYQHQMPYLLDRIGSETRWSYGLTAAQPQFAMLRDLTRGSKDDLTKGARALGFDGILIEKLGYTDAEIADLKQTIRIGIAPGCRLFEDQFRILYTLTSPADRAACLPEPASQG
ncbi:hypothetical protein [Bradyrhizobium cenepequi]